MKKITGILLMAVMLIMLTACGGGESPDAAVEKALTAAKAFDVDTMRIYFSEEDFAMLEDTEVTEDADVEELAKKLLSNLTFSIKETTDKGDTAVVKTEITNVDMGPIMAEYMGNLFGIAFSGISEDEMDKQAQEMLNNLLSREGNATVTATVDIQLTKGDEGWKITMTDELQDAILGGLGSGFGDTDGADSDDTDSDSDKLTEIGRWLSLSIWNEGFCDISHFLYDGQDSSGQTMDIDFTLSQLGIAMEKKPEYDAYIQGLTDAKYDNLKEIWSKLSAEIDNLYGKLQAAAPVAADDSYEFDLGLYTQYHDAFQDEKDRLSEEE